MSQNLTGDDITANVLIGAALMGAKDGVIESLTSKTEETRSLAANLIEPGDQRHIPHPWEDFKNSVKRTISLATTPGDMNPSHSSHPINATAQAHDASVKMATRMLEEKGVVEGIRTISAMAAAIAVDNADPFKKLQMVNKITEIPATAEPLTKKPVISWNDYAPLLGKGSQPPKLKPLRDFSDLMEYTPPRAGDWSSLLYYKPDDEHKISMRLYHLWGASGDKETMITAMRFTVRAEGNRELYGSGAEMFHSALKYLSQQGIKINEIQGSWGQHGALSTNYEVFSNARKQGESVKRALAMTPTGRWAADAGFTEAGSWPFNKEVMKRELPEILNPEFHRPKFHFEHKSYNDYGNAWASSQGTQIWHGGREPAAGKALSF
jgi:hypothetical protein